MPTIAFRMQLKPGAAAEYQRRHDAIWPELVQLLKASGARDYRIFLDEATGALFAVLSRPEDHEMDTLPAHSVMRRWWDHMAPLMECHDDNAPVVTPLREVFRLA